MENKNQNTLSDVILHHKDLFMWLGIICLIALGSIFWDTEWFRASILQIPEKFDWTVYPIEKVPNWSDWWKNYRTLKYSDISSSDLIPIPKYSDSLGWNWSSDLSLWSKEKNAKITYAVVYLWNYNIDNRYEESGSHPAVDILAPIWTPIRAIANWKIIKVVESSAWFWKHVILEMPNVPDVNWAWGKATYYASYCHLSEISVKEWDIVKKWQILWKTWNSWTSTTPHLHFQIDRGSLWWYPYWPFTSTEMYAANLNFFTAIREGLWQQNAKTNTINPMKWLEANLDNSFSWTVKPTKPNSSDTSLAEIKISGDSEFIGSVSLTLAALNKSWDLIDTYAWWSDISISSTSNSARFSKKLKFNDWIATVMIMNQTAEEFDFVVQVWSDKYTKTLTSKVKEEVVDKPTEPEETIDPKTEDNIPQEAWDIDNKVDILIMWSQKVNVNEVVTLDVYVNEKGTNAFAEVVRDYAIDLSGVWKLNSYILRKNDFVSSKAKLQFSSDKAWKAIININWQDFKIITESKTEVASLNSDISTKPEDSNTSTWTAELASTGSTESWAVTNSWATTDNEPTEESVFTDVDSDNINFKAISYLKSLWVVWGYPDWSFKPNKVVSRVEALKMIFAALQINTDDASTLPFSDTVQDAWYSKFVGSALTKKIVKWYSNWTFKPSQEVNRAEYYKILLLSAWIDTQAVNSDPYEDVPADSWFWSYVGFVKESKLSDAVGEFFPSEWVSRAEVAESIYRLLKMLWL